MKKNSISTFVILALLILAALFISGHLFSIACPSSQVVPGTGGGGCYTPPTINNVPPPLVLNNIAIWGNGNCNDWTASCYNGFVWSDTNTTINGVSNYSGWSYCDVGGGMNFCYGLNGTNKYNLYLGSNKSTGAIANNYNEQTLTVMQNILNYYEYDDCIPYDACYEGSTQAVQQAATAGVSYPVIIQQLQQAIAYNNALLQPNITTTINSTVCNTPEVPSGCQWVSTANATAPCGGYTSCPTTTVTTTTSTTTINTTFTSIPTSPPPPPPPSNIFTQITAFFNSIWQSIVNLLNI